MVRNSIQDSELKMPDTSHPDVALLTSFQDSEKGI